MGHYAQAPQPAPAETSLEPSLRRLAGHNLANSQGIGRHCQPAPRSPPGPSFRPQRKSGSPSEAEVRICFLGQDGRVSLDLVHGRSRVHRLLPPQPPQTHDQETTWTSIAS